MVGYFNTVTAAEIIFKDMPIAAKYGIFAISGTGPLWFAQDLWLFSLIFLLVRKLDGKPKPLAANTPVLPKPAALQMTRSKAPAMMPPMN